MASKRQPSAEVPTYSLVFPAGSRYIGAMFRAVTLAVLCAFLWGCGQPAREETQTQTNAAPTSTGLTGGTTDDSSFTTALTLSQPAKGFAAPKASGTVSSLLKNGMAYDGEWSNGKANGMGTLTDAANGTKLYGEWRDGEEYKVRGTFVFPDGTIEVGTWHADGSPCGGTITWTDGREYKGDWKLADNAPEIPDGHGQMTWPDGRKYIGQFQDGKMDGLGKMTYPDGKVELGVWKQDEFTGPAR
jgi:hypothetical protein